MIVEKKNVYVGRCMKREEKKKYINNHGADSNQTAGCDLQRLVIGVYPQPLLWSARVVLLDTGDEAGETNEKHQRFH